MKAEAVDYVIDVPAFSLKLRQYQRCLLTLLYYSLSKTRDKIAVLVDYRCDTFRWILLMSCLLKIKFLSKIEIIYSVIKLI